MMQCTHCESTKVGILYEMEKTVYGGVSGPVKIACIFKGVLSRG